MVQALQGASGYDLYRLRAAMDRTLQLRIGQTVHYFSDADNALRAATVLELRRNGCWCWTSQARSVG